MKEKKEKIFSKKVLINSAIASALVFIGAFTSGIITWAGIVGAITAAVLVFLTKLKENINKKTTAIFNFY